MAFTDDVLHGTLHFFSFCMILFDYLLRISYVLCSAGQKKTEINKERYEKDIGNLVVAPNSKTNKKMKMGRFFWTRCYICKVIRLKGQFFFHF